MIAAEKKSPLATWDITFTTQGYESQMRVKALSFDAACKVVFNYFPSPSTAIRTVRES